MHLVGMTKAAKPPTGKQTKSARKQPLAPKLPYLVKYRTRLPGIARPSGHMTQNDLAAKTGYSQGMISQWEDGKSDVTTENVHILAAALGITPEQLQYRDPDKGEHIADVWARLPQHARETLWPSIKVHDPEGRPKNN